MTGKELVVYARAKGNRVGTINQERNNDQPKELALCSLHLEYVHNFCVCIKMKWDEQMVLLGLGLVAAILAKKAGVDGSYDKNTEGIKKDLRILQEADDIFSHGSPIGKAMAEVITTLGNLVVSSGKKEKADEVTDRAMAVVAAAQAQVASASADQALVDNPGSVKKITDAEASRILGFPQDGEEIAKIILDGPTTPPIIFPVKPVPWDVNDRDVARGVAYKKAQFSGDLWYGRVWVFNAGPGQVPVPDDLHVLFFRPVVNDEGNYMKMGFIGAAKCEKVNQSLITGDMFQTALLTTKNSAQTIYKVLPIGDVRCLFTIGLPTPDQLPTLSIWAEKFSGIIPQKPDGDNTFPIFRHNPNFVPRGYTLLPNGGYEAD
jgi:hypothetical protein